MLFWVLSGDEYLVRSGLDRDPRTLQKYFIMSCLCSRSIILYSCDTGQEGQGERGARKASYKESEVESELQGERGARKASYKESEVESELQGERGGE